MVPRILGMVAPSFRFARGDAGCLWSILWKILAPEGIELTHWC
jgi:hypothetical protein